MRETTHLYRGIDRLNYLCVAARLLGFNTLTPMPVLLSGFTTVTRHTAHPQGELILANLRHLGQAVTTRKGLIRLAQKYSDYHDLRDAGQLGFGEDLGFDRRFVIDRNLTFQTGWGTLAPYDITDLEALLVSLFLDKPVQQPTATPTQAISIAPRSEAIEDYRGTVSELPSTLPPAPQHDMTRTPAAHFRLSWTDILAEADDMDRVEHARGLEPMYWRARLEDPETGAARAALKRPGASGLEDADAIEFDGVKHLIGLPSAGKTTLLHIMARAFKRHGVRALFLFPSIQVTAAFIERLDQLDCPVGLLVGQSENTRRRHTNRLAERLSSDPAGIGASAPSARLFGTNCTLAAFASEDDAPFPHMAPPCRRLRQEGGGRRPREKLCPLASVCGRHAGARELVEHDIWAGHIASTDTEIPPHFSPVRLRYFEHVARSFDIVIVDEADGAQQILDDQGSAALKLYGHSDALTTTITNHIQARASRGDNAMLNDVAVHNFSNEAGRLEITAKTAVPVLATDCSEPVVRRFQGQLLTTARLFASLYPAPAGDDAAQERSEQIELVWTQAAKNAVYNPDADQAEDFGGDDIPLDVDRAAAVLGVPRADILSLIEALTADMRAWMRFESIRDKRERCAAMIKRFTTRFPAGAADPPAIVRDMFTLAFVVTMLTLQYQRIAPRVREMIARGVLPDDIAETTPSRDLMNKLPESLVGSFTGVRYELDGTDRRQLELQFIAFESAPRMLLYRWGDMLSHEGRSGPAVLLTSATSWFEASPSHHISVAPNYLLARSEGANAWDNSVYRFLPLEARDGSGEMLNVSGAGFRREENLLAIVEGLLQAPPSGSSIVDGAINSADVVEVDGEMIPRAAALVVNSFAQVAAVMDFIENRFGSAVADRCRGITSMIPDGKRGRRFATAGRVESLGADMSWDILIFPMNAIGRGVNIVFGGGPRAGQARIGSIFFLIRPHPTADSLNFVQALSGRSVLDFEQSGPYADLDQALDAYAHARRTAYAKLSDVISRPLAISHLGPLARPFTADIMVGVQQTIGRAMRGDRPAFVYFVDTAWAPRTARGGRDTARTSMLYMMNDILSEMMSHPDPGLKAVHEQLYSSFQIPLSRMIQEIDMRATAGVGT